MIDILVWLAVFIIVAIVAWWLISQVAMPEPIRRIVTIVFVVVAAVIAIVILLQLTGVGPPLRLK